MRKKLLFLYLFFCFCGVGIAQNGPIPGANPVYNIFVPGNCKPGINCTPVYLGVYLASPPPTAVPTNTPTPTYTATLQNTPASGTQTWTPTFTFTITQTPTVTNTFTPTGTPTSTPTPNTVPASQVLPDNVTPVVFTAANGRTFDHYLIQVGLTAACSSAITLDCYPQLNGQTNGSNPAQIAIGAGVTKASYSVLQSTSVGGAMGPASSLQVHIDAIPSATNTAIAITVTTCFAYTVAKIPGAPDGMVYVKTWVRENRQEVFVNKTWVDNFDWFRWRCS